MAAKLTTLKSNSQNNAYRHLWQLVDRWTKEYESDVDGPAPDALLPLLQSQMQRDIRNIIDQLDMMIQIIREQKEVVGKFVRLAKDILESRDDYHAVEVPDQERPRSEPEGNVRARQFGKLADDLLNDISARLEELGRLKRSGMSTQHIVYFPSMHIQEHLLTGRRSTTSSLSSSSRPA